MGHGWSPSIVTRHSCRTPTPHHVGRAALADAKHKHALSSPSNKRPASSPPTHPHIYILTTSDTLPLLTPSTNTPSSLPASMPMRCGRERPVLRTYSSAPAGQR
eukprot:358608-Chlamydomonas_euryale.AAC.1